MHRREFLAAGAVATATVALAPRSVFAADPNTLTAEEQAAGWKLLFDGKSTTGWRNYKKPAIGDGWKVLDGALARVDRGAGDIVTAEQYGEFELRLDYRIGKAGNSGLMYAVSEGEGPPWHTGPEVQIQDNVDGHDPQKAGWLYQLYPAEKDATKPAGEWNTLGLLLTKAKCAQTMNGVLYCEYVRGSDDWNARVAKSKFAKFPNFGKNERGHICLQDHGDPVAFRNIKVRVIS
jgi:hypothetical protein